MTLRQCVRVAEVKHRFNCCLYWVFPSPSGGTKATKKNPKELCKVKSNLSLCSLYYVEACYEFAGPISASFHPSNTGPFEEMSQRWRAVGNTAQFNRSDIEPQISQSRNERVTARPTSWCSAKSVREIGNQPNPENSF